MLNVVKFDPMLFLTWFSWYWLHYISSYHYNYMSDITQFFSQIKMVSDELLYSKKEKELHGKRD